MVLAVSVVSVVLAVLVSDADAPDVVVSAVLDVSVAEVEPGLESELELELEVEVELGLVPEVEVEAAVEPEPESVLELEVELELELESELWELFGPGSVSPSFHFSPVRDQLP